MKIWEDERQCYIRAAMEKNSEAENEALKAQPGCDRLVCVRAD